MKKKLLFCVGAVFSLGGLIVSAISEETARTEMKEELKTEVYDELRAAIYEDFIDKNEEEES